MLKKSCLQINLVNVGVFKGSTSMVWKALSIKTINCTIISYSLLDEVFVVSRITKVEVGVNS